MPVVKLNIYTGQDIHEEEVQLLKNESGAFQDATEDELITAVDFRISVNKEISGIYIQRALVPIPLNQFPLRRFLDYFWLPAMTHLGDEKVVNLIRKSRNQANQAKQSIRNVSD